MTAESPKSWQSIQGHHSDSLPAQQWAWSSDCGNAGGGVRTQVGVHHRSLTHHREGGCHHVERHSPQNRPQNTLTVCGGILRVSLYSLLVKVVTGLCPSFIKHWPSFVNFFTSPQEMDTRFWLNITDMILILSPTNGAIWLHKKSQGQKRVSECNSEFLYLVYTCYIKIIEVLNFFYTHERTFRRIMLWRMLSVHPSVCPSVCLALAKSCPLINFKPISPRLTFLCIINGHDP